MPHRPERKSTVASSAGETTHAPPPERKSSDGRLCHATAAAARPNNTPRDPIYPAVTPASLTANESPVISSADLFQLACFVGGIVEANTVNPCRITTTHFLEVHHRHRQITETDEGCDGCRTAMSRARFLTLYSGVSWRVNWHSV
jgi:hypothetical protein